MNKFILLVLAAMTQISVFGSIGVEGGFSSPEQAENFDLHLQLSQVQGQLEEALQKLAKDREQIVKDEALKMTLHLHLNTEDEVGQGLTQKAILKVLYKWGIYTKLTLTQFPVYSYLANNPHENAYSKEKLLRNFEARLMIINNFVGEKSTENPEILALKGAIEQWIQLVTEKLEGAEIIKISDRTKVLESAGSIYEQYYYFHREVDAITEEFIRVMLPYFDIELSPKK